MESLAETRWDVVISGTGLQQSLLALALSRSGKNVLHVDPNEFYGADEAAFTLQEVDDWARKNAEVATSSVFKEAEVEKVDDGRLSSSRAYSIALAPQLIHARSELLAQLVSSKAFRQVEFLAVGSFHIFQPAADASAPTPSLSRIPSTREDVFLSKAIPARAKRSLMKFLKFALEYDEEAHREVWSSHADEPLSDFLASEFKLDEGLQADVITLTLSLDGRISVGAGLAAINRHMTSMGLFGAGFAAVYPKWGGLSEVAQVGCRAGAVGGAVYMLGTAIRDVQQAEKQGVGGKPSLYVSLSNEVRVEAEALVQGSLGDAKSDQLELSKLTAVVCSNMPHVFEATVDGAPTPAVAVVAFPAGSISADDGAKNGYPIYAMVHSSDTGECPSGQCIVYLSTVSTSASRTLLEIALSSLLKAVAGLDEAPPPWLYKLRYTQVGDPASANDVDGSVVSFPPLPLDLAFKDDVMGRVRSAWESVTKTEGSDEGAEYMNFDDREGAVDDDRYD